MITSYLRYEIDLLKLKEFETYGRMWIPLVTKPPSMTTSSRTPAVGLPPRRVTVAAAGQTM